MSTIELPGCTPEPLMNYLKALGVLRIIVEQGADPNARGFWKHNVFCLRTQLTEDRIIEFFATRYKPSPILSPWNKAAGFTNKRGADVDEIRRITESRDQRIASIKNAAAEIHAVRKLVGEHSEKDEFILQLRNRLSDQSIQWIDACSTYADEKCQYAPLLGTGGNVGKMEISINYIKNVSLVTGEKKSASWMRSCLMGTNSERSILSSISQFAPGRVGGANGTQGMEGKSMINPWDYVLMVEGSLFLSGTTSRKLSSGKLTKSAFPFTTGASPVGNSTLAQSDIDKQKGKGEIWLPLWERPASVSELKSLFGEGRAELNGRQASSGVDFARAVATLGVDRGIKYFIRFSFVEFVKAGVMATPLGRFEVAARNDASLFREIDPWLSGLRRSCGDKKAPVRLRAALREIERSIFDYCQYGDSGNDKARFQKILVTLAHAEQYIAASPGFRSSKEAKGIRPIASLSPQWVSASDDQSTEFRIALALASISSRELGSMRQSLENVKALGSQYAWSENSHSVVWSGVDLATNLSAVLYRRVMDAERAGDPASALTSSHRATLADVGEFLVGNLDEVRISSLLWGLSLCRTWEYRRELNPSTINSKRNSLILPAAYCLLKLLFHTYSVQQAVEESESLRPNLGILGLLRANRAGESCQLAARLLRGKSLKPMPSPMQGFPSRDDEWFECNCTAISSGILAAALLIPITDLGLDSLKERVLRVKPEPNH